MNRLLVLGTVCLLPLSAFAEKTCKVNLTTRTYLDEISTEEVRNLAEKIASPTNIELVETGADFDMKLKAFETVDHHDTSYAYVHGSVGVWPSNQIEDRSAVKTEFGTGIIEREDLTRKLILGILKKTLTAQLKSCEAIDKKIKSTGNGTLNPVDGDIYVTKEGAAFERVGTYWKDPSGLLWGETLVGTYLNANANSPAVKACSELGARLPTVEDYKDLLTYFSPSTDGHHALSKKGKFDFNALFPWSDGMFWTDTREADGVGHDFHHVSGGTSPAMAHWKLNVRCVK